MQLIHCIITYAHNVIETERIFFWWKVYLEKTSVIARIRTGIFACVLDGLGLSGAWKILERIY